MSNVNILLITSILLRNIRWEGIILREGTVRSPRNALNKKETLKNLNRREGNAEIDRKILWLKENTLNWQLEGDWSNYKWM